MAKSRLDLQSYQQGILDRLKHVASDPEAGSSWLGVFAGGERYLFSLRDISEVLPVPTLLPVPLTQPWFMGLANVRGKLFAVTDLARFLGARRQPVQVTAESRVLLVHNDFEINAGFLVDGLAGLRKPADLKPLEMVADASTCAIAAYEDGQHHKWEALEMALLLQKKEFMQVAA